MKRKFLIFLLIDFIFFCSSHIYAQESAVFKSDTLKTENKTGFQSGIKDSSPRSGRNYLIVTFGFVEMISVCYERNIFRFPGGNTNLKLGWGFLNDLQGGANEYFGSLVQLFGRRNSHLELNLGYRQYKNVKENSNPSVVGHAPYAWAGYRYEKPDGNFLFRTGFIYWNIYAIEIGIGVKF